MAGNGLGWSGLACVQNRDGKDWEVWNGVGSNAVSVQLRKVSKFMSDTAKTQVCHKVKQISDMRNLRFHWDRLFISTITVPDHTGILTVCGCPKTALAQPSNDAMLVRSADQALPTFHMFTTCLIVR